MNKETSLLLRLMAVASLMVFVALLTLSILALVTQRQFLRAAPYIGALQEVNAYERAPGVLAEIITNSFNGEPGPLAQLLPLPDLNQADVELFLSLLLPRDWLQSQSELIVTRAVAELNGNAPPQPAVLSLTEPKARLGGPAGREALVSLIEQRPACGPADLAAFTCGFNLAGEIACRPPTLNLDLCSAALDLAIGGLVTQIPDQIDLDLVLQLSSPFTAPLRDYARRYASVVTFVARFGWFLALPFLFLATLLAVRSLSGWLRWWGAPLLGVSFALLPAIALTALFPAWYVAAPLQELATMAPAFSLLLADVAGVLSRGLVLQLLIAAFLLGVIGGGMVVLSFVAPWLQRWVAQG